MYTRLNTPILLKNIKYLSINNFAWNILITNQWINVKELNCEYDVPLFCIQDGASVLKEEKLDPVI